VFGAVGASWAFLAEDDAPQALVLLPAALMLAFLVEASSVTSKYLALPDIGTTDEGSLDRPA
jgi:hypothetical protein